jgi:hypothetical protein
MPSRIPNRYLKLSSRGAIIIITGDRGISGKTFQADGFILGIEESITQMILNDLSFDPMPRFAYSIRIMFPILLLKSKLSYWNANMKTFSDCGTANES